MLAASLGTSTSWPAGGGILLLEDDNEEEYRLDRMLTQLRRSGYLRGVAGIMAGTFVGCGEPELIQEVLAERLGDLGVPMIAWANIGHGGYFQTFPIGIAAELDADAKTLRLLDPPLVPAQLHGGQAAQLSEAAEPALVKGRPVMKILISADMEGATGVTWPADVEPGTEQWQRCRRMFTSDVNAAVAGFLDGGADEVLINEAHSTMRNLLLEELDERAVMLTGRHKDLSMVEGIQHGDVDGVAFVGYHAAAGADGVLAHTYLANSITAVRVNGERASEGLLNSFVAAQYGVPVVLITGDDRTCADAARYAPDAPSVAVKDCVTRYAAICRPPAVTAAAIRQSAAKAVGLARRSQPRSDGELRDRGGGGRGAACAGGRHRARRAADGRPDGRV